MPSPQTIDEYIAASSVILASNMERIQALVPLRHRRLVSYRMPAFFLDGVLVYFAAFKKHIGFFPPVRDEALKPLLARYAGPKGNLQFPLSEPIPHALISRIVKARIKECHAVKAAKSSRLARVQNLQRNDDNSADDQSLEIMLSNKYFSLRTSGSIG